MVGFNSNPLTDAGSSLFRTLTDQFARLGDTFFNFPRSRSLDYGTGLPEEIQFALKTGAMIDKNGVERLCTSRGFEDSAVYLACKLLHPDRQRQNAFIKSVLDLSRADGLKPSVVDENYEATLELVRHYLQEVPDGKAVDGHKLALISLYGPFHWRMAGRELVIEVLEQERGVPLLGAYSMMTSLPSIGRALRPGQSVVIINDPETFDFAGEQIGWIIRLEDDFTVTPLKRNSSLRNEFQDLPMILIDDVLNTGETAASLHREFFDNEHYPLLDPHQSKFLHVFAGARQVFLDKVRSSLRE